jgi:hypothetical protein
LHNAGPVGNGSCVGEWACFATGTSSAIGDNSCNGERACYLAGSADIGTGNFLIGNGSCNGSEACFSAGAAYSGAGSVEIGDDSCNGTRTCYAAGYSFDTTESAIILNGSCNDEGACYSATGTVGNNSCNGVNACLVGGTIGDCEQNTDTVPACVLPTPIVVVPDSGQMKYAGQPDPALTFTSSPLDGTDTFSGALSRAPGEAPGSYVITLGTLATGPDYDVTLAPSTVNFVIVDPFDVLNDAIEAALDKKAKSFLEQANNIVTARSDNRGLCQGRAPLYGLSAIGTWFLHAVSNSETAQRVFHRVIGIDVAGIGTGMDQTPVRTGRLHHRTAGVPSSGR